MVLIDQHAAHERVHYERILQAFSEQHECVQPLLVPRLVELTPVQHALVAQRAELLVAIGVVVEPFGGHALLVRAHPPWMEDELHDIIESVLVQGRFDRMEWRDHTAKRLACRSSVRAHEPQTIEAMRDLVHQLSACTDPFMCPHGRPTMVRWSAHELAKRFGRSS
jgi:DNA mismatch repair protein MutL